MARKKGSDNFGFRSPNEKSPQSDFSFGGVRGASTTNQLNKIIPIKEKFRPNFNLKDFSILYDYQYASMWTRWRRGYELYMYANQAYVGLNYSFRYFISGEAGVGAAIPGICYMYPSMSQDMAMRMTVIRPRDSFNFLDFGYAIKSILSTSTENVYAIELSSNFGAPISFFTGEVLSDRFSPDGTEKTTYSSYVVIGVGNGPNALVPNFAPIFNTIFISLDTDNSWKVVDNSTLKSPADLPTPGDYFSTEMRFGCNCPDYLGREEFNLYKYNTKRRYPYTGVQDLKPGIYDVGADFTEEGQPREVATRDYTGYIRDFGFIYIQKLLEIAAYRDNEKVYSDPNLIYWRPRWCKHIYASFWDLQNKFGKDVIEPTWLNQPSDEPMDGAYLNHFYTNMEKQTSFKCREKRLSWWEKFSPSRDTTPVHMLYPDMNPTVTKVLNFDTLNSGVTNPLSPSGFEMFDIDQYNPFLPPDPETTPRIDGGQYFNGVLVSGASLIYDGGSYVNGVLTPYPSFPSITNGGTY